MKYFCIRILDTQCMIFKYIYVNKIDFITIIILCGGRVGSIGMLTLITYWPETFSLSFFLIEGFHLWFSFIACPQHLQMIDIEAHCCLLCQIFVETHMCWREQESPWADGKACFFFNMRSYLTNTENCLEIMYCE